MDENRKLRLKKHDLLSFNSLSSIGIDWRSVVKNNAKLEKEYLNYLSLKDQYILVNL